MSTGKFLDLDYVLQCFTRCLMKEDDVIIDSFLQGYTELVKFLHLIGTVFSFVSSDVKSKIKVMEKLRTGEDAIYYESFKDMMRYELEAGLLDKDDFVSGSRTMLRLHRGLDFIRVFLHRINEGAESSTHTICQLSYNETLAEYHPWYIRKAANLAMHTLPTRAELIMKLEEFVVNLVHVSKILKLPKSLEHGLRTEYSSMMVVFLLFFLMDNQVFGRSMELADAMLILPDTLRSCDEVYRRVQQLYTDFDLHGLP